MTRSTSASFRIAHTGYPPHCMAAFASCFLLSPLSPFPSRGRFPSKWEDIGISAFSREDDCIGFGSRLWSGNSMFIRPDAPVHIQTKFRTFWSMRSPFRVNPIFACWRITDLSTIHITFFHPDSPWRFGSLRSEPLRFVPGASHPRIAPSACPGRVEGG